MSVVLVTGASSGFGRLTVEGLGRRGHQAFAGLRDVAGRNEKAAAELTEAGVHVVELDVTDQESADRAVATVLATAGGLDVVVNNAGGVFPGPLEPFTAEEAQRQFDVNVFGALRVNRAALPHLREQRHGAVIQIGSLGGRVTVPYAGLYSASKAALASLTDAWHHELAPFGVESVIVEPAPYATNIGVNASMAADQERLAAYGEGFGAYIARITEVQTGAPADPREVADAVVRLVETPDGSRPRWTVIGPDNQAGPIERVIAAEEQATREVAAGMGIEAFLA
ncbi:SDR family oxidoreductase [Actinoplanes sp. NBRC 103695]|uniref:SDR family oxidoreductase n=1 Tax=Actinoplanes sp. NBRC 103695 TaxID=3032202 RepID=UPI0024A22111|nr:SDR family oxidoreductase [Actinoplanes sp. NBRC 103695]GLY99135.1 short-chain dehydrogenase/reductase [Actinoplanes sp. NBRC 103695]